MVAVWRYSLRPAGLTIAVLGQAGEEDLVEAEQEGYVPTTCPSYEKKRRKGMKIAVSATGDSLSSALNPRFGRCEYFVLYDSEREKVSSVENGSRLSTGGAGVATAKMLIDLGVDAVVTGFVGPKAYTALQAAKIKVYVDAQGTVQDALEQFKQNKLTEAQRANAGAHSHV